MSSLKVMVSGGGTGGHIFPAVAIANAIKSIRPDAEFLFVGAKGKMEMEKVPAAGYQIEGLWISGLQRSLTLKNLSFPFKVIHSMMRARKLVKQFKPDVVIGTGGFASGPTLKAAAALGIPTIIQEQNSFPGMTNRILGKNAKRVCVAYEGMDQYFESNKVLFTGNPVRQQVTQIEGKRNEAMSFFGLDAAKPVVLIVGGSLGAQSINRAIMPSMAKLVEAGVQLIWQTGKPSFEEAKQAATPYADQGIKVFDFIQKMELAYAAANVVISRAGAIAVSELCLVKKPCILVPFPFAAEDHQTKNAMALVNHHAAIHIADKEANEQLVSTVLALVTDEQKQEELAKQISGLGKPDAALRIAEEAVRIANK